MFLRVPYEEWDGIWAWKSLWKSLWHLAEVGTLIEIGKGIFSSVVIVWFIFQTGEVFMSAFQDFLDKREAREEKARQKERERVLVAVENVLKNHPDKKFSNEEFLQAVESACSYSRDNK